MYFRGNRMRGFFTRHGALPSCLMYSPESRLVCNIAALNFSLHIKVPYGESLPSVICALYQPGEFQCLHLYCLTILKKKKIHLLLMCIALSTVAEWSQSNCFIISNTPFGNQQPTVNKLCTTFLLWRWCRSLELIYTIVFLVLAKLYIKKIG